MEQRNDCVLCADRPAEIKITATDLNGILLDNIRICRVCLEKYGKDLELSVGK
jgi:hypothetical protein